MRGAPWEGLFYGFVVEFMVAIGSLTYALSSPDFLARTIAWALFVVVVVLGFRTLRRVGSQEEHDRPTGRWWFGG